MQDSVYWTDSLRYWRGLAATCRDRGESRMAEAAEAQAAGVEIVLAEQEIEV